jgi:DNA-binding HxlR family transcriptional regulator
MTTTQNIGCVKEATKVLGDKWTPQLLRFFVNKETVRFCQIQDLVEGINPRTLSSRLDSLEAEGIIEKVTAPEKSRCEYRLTKKGAELTPILRDMQAWSEHYA